MFTGIIECIGIVRAIRRGARSATLVIAAPEVVEGTEVGDSIATNGVCLTVTSIEGGTFSADVMPETMRRTALGELEVGSRVNLERALRLDSRLGGHLVTGHVDGTGRIVSMVREDNAVRIRVGAPRAIMRYVIPKGSVALEGVSLTVTEVTEEGFEVSVIPHTQQATTLTSMRTGDAVNIENDVVGKYVERFLSPTPASGGLTLEKLLENGF